MKKKFDFENITLIPNYSYVESRSECKTTIKFGHLEFKLPIVPSNMESIIDSNLAIKLAKNNYFYIMHRFNINPVEFTSQMHRLGLYSSVSIGVNEDSYEYINQFVELGLCPEYITIDIAHGHCVKMKKMVKYIKENLPNTFLIGGNVSTPDAVEDLQKWGCDAIKCGIGGGSACTTYHSTGFGNRGWQANMILDCSKVSKVPIIADGSIKEHSDIVKSLVLGATMVMVGGMLSGYVDSPGEKVKNLVDGLWYKEFWGSASSSQSGKTNRIEGIKKLVPYKNHSIFNKLTQIEESLQSAISYAGGNPSNLESLDMVKYCIKMN
jgi:GMP reductase